MTERLEAAQVLRALERGRDVLSANRRRQLVSLARRLDSEHGVGLDVALDELAGGDGDLSGRLTRLRRVRKDLESAFAEAGMTFSLEVSRGRQPPSRRRAWFVGNDDLLGSVNERTRTVLRGADAVYGRDQYVPVDASAALPASIVVSHEQASTGPDALKLVEQIQTALRALGHEHLAKSLRTGADTSRNQPRAERAKMLSQAHLVLVLWTTAWQADAWVRDHVRPLIDPQRTEPPHPDCLGIVFGPCTHTDSELNDLSRFDEDGQGGINWMRPDRASSVSGLGPPDRERFAQQIAATIVARLAEPVPAAPDARARVHSRVRRMLAQDAARDTGYLNSDFEEPLASPALLAREGRRRQLARTTKASARSEGSYPLLATLVDWTLDPASPAVHAVLGDFGSGKTFTARMLAQRLLEEHPERVTIYVDLRDIALAEIIRSPKLDTVFDGWLHHWRLGLDDPDITLAELKRTLSGDSLVIFDGFDEVCVHLEQHASYTFLQELMRVVTPGSRNSAGHPKLLITCRSHYFPTLSKQNALLGDEARGRTSSQGGVDDLRLTGSIVLPFTTEQIRSALARRLGDDEVESALSLIGATHDLANLAERPYLLALIRDRLRELEHQTASGRPVNAVTLYRLLCDDALQRDERKHVLEPDDKLELTTRLAATLWGRGERTLSFDELRQWLCEALMQRPDWTARYLGERVDLAIRDMHTATFLVRTGEDRFRFAHTSLLEYFVAERLYRCLLRDERDGWLGLHASKETVAFLLQAIDLATAPDELWGRLAVWARCGYDSGASLTQLTLAQQAVERGRTIVWPQMDLRGADLHDRTIGVGDLTTTAPADRPTLVLDGVRLDGANVRRVDWLGVGLEGACFRGAKGSQSRFLGCRAREAAWTSASLAGAIFRGCDLDPAASKRLIASSSAVRILQPVCRGDDSSFPNGDLEWRASGHSGYTTACVLSPAGDRLASTGGDGTLRLWDVADGRELRRFEGHEGPVAGFAFSPAGDRLAIVGGDGTLRLWDVADGRELRRFGGYGDRARSFAFSPAGDRLAIAGGDGTLRLWDVADGRELRRFEGHEGLVTSCAFSPAGDRLASAGHDDGTLRLWDVADGRELRRFEGREDWVSGFAFSPAGDRLASTGRDGTLRLWDVADGRELRRFEGHEGPVAGFAFSPAGDRLASAGGDGTLRLWDVADGRELRRFEGHGDLIVGCAFSPAGDRLASAGGDGTLRLWDVADGQELRRFEGHGDLVVGCAFSPAGDRLASAGGDGTLRLWDVADGRELRRFEGREDWVSGCAFSPAGDRLASAGGDGTLRLWDVADGRELRRFEGHEGRITGCAFSPAGDRLASAGGDDGTLRLWDVADGRELRRFEGHEGPVAGFAFSPAGDRLASAGGDDGTLRLWDVADGRELRRFEGHEGRITGCAFSPAGDRLASVGGDGTPRLRLWDVADGRELRRFEGHGDLVVGCAFSPAGDRLASAGGDGTLRLWDVADGRELRRFEGHEGRITSFAFSPAGDRLAIAGRDGTLRLWDVADGRELRRFEGHEGRITGCAFSPAGDRLASAGRDGTLRLWGHTQDIGATLDRALVLYTFRDGWAAVDKRKEDLPRFGGAGWYRLRAFGRDRAGQYRQWMVDEVIASRGSNRPDATR